MLTARDFVMRMRRQAGVENLADFGVRIEMARHSDAVGVVLQHANRERLDAARNEEAIHGREARSRGALDEINFLRVLGTREHHRAASGIAVAVQILRHGVNHNVRAEFDGPLQIGTQKRVIDDDRKVAVAGEFGNGRDIRNAHSGVSWRLKVQHFRIWT